jgi:outer membrane protein assembly factor BamB
VLTTEGVLFGREEVPSDNRMIATSNVVFPELEAAVVASVEQVKPKPRPLVADHRLITVDDGFIVATNRHSGRRLWQSAMGGDSPADISSPLLWAGHSILLATTGGNVVRIEPDTGDVTSTFSLGQGALASQPIAVGGFIYAGTVGGSVVAFDTRDPELTGWEMLGGTPDRQGTVLPAAPTKPEGT